MSLTSTARRAAKPLAQILGALGKEINRPIRHMLKQRAIAMRMAAPVCARAPAEFRHR